MRNSGLEELRIKCSAFISALHRFNCYSLCFSSQFKYSPSLRLNDPRILWGRWWKVPTHASSSDRVWKGDPHKSAHEGTQQTTRCQLALGSCAGPSRAVTPPVSRGRVQVAKLDLVCSLSLVELRTNQERFVPRLELLYTTALFFFLLRIRAGWNSMSEGINEGAHRAADIAEFPLWLRFMPQIQTCAPWCLLKAAAATSIHRHENCRFFPVICRCLCFCAHTHSGLKQI